MRDRDAAAAAAAQWLVLSFHEAPQEAAYVDGRRSDDAARPPPRPHAAGQVGVPPRSAPPYS